MQIKNMLLINMEGDSNILMAQQNDHKDFIIFINSHIDSCLGNYAL